MATPPTQTPTQTPTIRPLKAGDRSALANILSSDGTFTTDEKSVALELIDDALENGDSDYWIRIAILETAVGLPKSGEKNLVAGYICYGPTPMTASTFDLYWIVTHQNARGRGVAKRLIQAMEEDLGARGVTGIRVETSVKESHDAARRLYAALAYPIAAQFPDFYSEGDDLIVYYKQFSADNQFPDKHPPKP